MIFLRYSISRTKQRQQKKFNSVLYAW